MEINSKKTVPEKQLVIFSLTSESYGVDIGTVSEIIRLQGITKVPRTPRFVEGVINLRGKVIPVVNMRKIFYLPDGEHTKETRIVVVDIEGQQIGMMVDAVTEVLRIPADSVEPPSSLITTADSDYLLGIAKLKDRMITLLDLNKILSHDQAEKLSEMDMPGGDGASLEKEMTAKPKGAARKRAGSHEVEMARA